MTVKQLYEYALIELNKLKAPSILIEDFVYLLNKAIQQHINLVYNRAEYNQQSSDDLSFLQTDCIIKAGDCPVVRINGDTVWRLKLPNDYVHMLNCIATFTGGDKDVIKRCSNKEDKSEITSLCRRLTADIYPDVLRNYYLKPSHKNPYWQIVNHVDEGEKVDINKSNYSQEDLDDAVEDNDYRYIYMKDKGDRTANQSSVNIEIHSGSSS